MSFLRLFLIGLLFQQTQLLSAQVDSLVQLAESAEDDSVCTYYWHAAADELFTDSAIVILTSRLKIAERSGQRFWRAKLNQTLGRKYAQVRGNLDSLHRLSERSFKLFQELNYPVEKGRAIMQMGIADMSQGRREVAMNNFMEVIRIFEENHAHEKLAAVYINMAAIYSQAGENEKEVELLFQANAIAKRFKDYRNEANTCLGISTFYKNEGELDSASIYTARALTLAKQLNDPILNAYCLNSLASIEHENGNIERAEAYYAELLNQPAGDHEAARFNFYVGQFYYKLDRHRAAEKYLRVALNTAKKISAQELILNIGALLTKSLEVNGKHEEAAQVAHDYINLLDSVQTTEVRTNVNELTLKYETEKKEKENQQLLAEQAENELAILKLRTKLRKQLFLVAFALMSLLFFGILYWLNQRNQKQKLALNEQRSLLQEQRIRELETDQIISSIKSLVKGQEEERSRIAKELHDGMGSLISSLKLSLSKLPSYSERMDYHEHVDKLLALSTRANTELRRIAQNLMPETLTRFGLIAAIEDFVAEINYNDSIQIDFRYFYKNEDLPNDLALSIYRIIQELLNNSIKHAGSKEIFVQLMKHEEMINITVEDDGEGFDVASVIKGNGLQNIQSRLAFFEGEMRIESKLGEGTSVYIECPIPLSDSVYSEEKPLD